MTNSKGWQPREPSCRACGPARTCAAGARPALSGETRRRPEVALARSSGTLTLAPVFTSSIASNNSLCNPQVYTEINPYGVVGHSFRKNHRAGPPLWVSLPPPGHPQSTSRRRTGSGEPQALSKASLYASKTERPPRSLPFCAMTTLAPSLEVNPCVFFEETEKKLYFL